MSNDEFKIIGKCPVTGFAMKTKDSWKLDTKNYSAHPYIIGESLVFVNSIGSPSIETIRYNFELFKDLKTSFPKTKKFILISNQEKVKKIPAKARREYIDFIKNESSISAVIFYNANRVTRLSLKIGRAVMSTHLELYITQNYRESIFKSFEILSGNKNNISINKSIKNLIFNEKNKLFNDFKTNILNLIKTKKLYKEENLELLNTFLLNIDWSSTVSDIDISIFKNTPFKLIYETIIFIKSEMDNLTEERNLQKKELEQLNISLEKKVEERTIELEKINKNLKEEILFRKVIEKNLIRAKELAENANKAKSLFLANISHELKTPMNSILGYSSIGINKIEQIDKSKGKAYFEKINKSGKRLLKLLEDLIDSAKSENLEIKYYFEEINLLQILNLAVSEISYKAKEKKVSIVMEYDEDENYNLNADKKRIRQVIDNIIVNAIKFTQENTILNVCLFKRNKTLLVKIKDEGIGIEKNDLVRIFDSFYQSPKSQNNTHRGAGLGLAISQKIISAHNGQIWANNRTDGVKGAIFQFELPIK